MSVSSNLFGKPVFLSNSSSKDLVGSFTDALYGLATHTNAQRKLKFLENETSVKEKLNQLFSFIDQRRSRINPVMEFEHGCFKEQEHDASKQYLLTQKNQLTDLQNQLEKCCNVLSLFGFNSAKSDMN